DRALGFIEEESTWSRQYSRKQAMEFLVMGDDTEVHQLLLTAAFPSLDEKYCMKQKKYLQRAALLHLQIFFLKKELHEFPPDQQVSIKVEAMNVVNYVLKY